MDALHGDPHFNAMLPEAQAQVIAASHDVVYMIDRLLAIRAYNDGYARFGVLNGCPRVAEDFGIGCQLISVLPPVPADLCAMETGTRCDHDYECSSPQVYRCYHQSAYPLADGKGLIVSNHLVYERPHTWRAQGTSPRHLDAQGWLTQCACCRKVRDNAHAYCLSCLNFYYGDLLGTTTTAS